MLHQRQKTDLSALAPTQDRTSNLLKVPSFAPLLFVTVGISLFLIAYLGAQTFQWRTTHSDDLAGVTKMELLDARANPMLMEADIGVSAAIVSQLDRVCEDLPSPSDRKDCLTAIYPGQAEVAPRNLENSRLVQVLARQQTLGHPGIEFTSVPAETLYPNAVHGWTVRSLSSSLASGNRRTRMTVLWLKPTPEVSDSCGYHSRADEELSLRVAADFFGRIVSASSGDVVDVAGLGAGHLGRAYIVFPSGDLIIWVPGDRKIDDELRSFGDVEDRNVCLVKYSEYFRPLPKRSNGSRASVRYTGVYLDTAGLGFNATVLAPLNFATQPRPVGAIDFTFDPNLLAGRTGGLASLVAVSLPIGVKPSWETMFAALDSMKDRSPRLLKERVSDCLKRHPESAVSFERIISCGADQGDHLDAPGLTEKGRAIAVYLGKSKWLIAYFPRDADVNPLLPMLIAICMACSVVWLASRLFKSNVTLRTFLSTLDAMNVPLTVSDPSSDRVDSGNRAALQNGLAPAEHFGRDVIDIEDRAQYTETQVPGPSARSYVVRVRGQSTSRYALFRSAPIDGPPGYLSARRGDRLAIILPMDPKTDIEQISRSIDSAIRFQFTQLLDHGLLSWTRVLRVVIEKNQELASTLVKLIHRNQLFIVSMFSWYKGRSTLPGDVEAVDKESVQSTVNLCMSLFATVAADENLRRELGLSNGTLSGCLNVGAPFKVGTFVWPDRSDLHVPISGALGFFLAEALRNAVRHGKPGTTPEMTITSDAASQSILFQIRNDVLPGRSPSQKRLGGVELMRDAANILRWRFDSGPVSGLGEEYLCSWEIPLVPRSQA